MKTDNRIMLFDTSVLKDEEIFLKYYEKMPKERKKKIDALKPEGSKRLCLGAGILLDMAIGPYDISFGPQGKPYVDGAEIFFNLSHSGDMAVIAVSDREVGVDIQKLKHFKESLVDHVFNIEDRELAGELVAEFVGSSLKADAAQSGDSSFDQVYTRMWAMKESVMKYTGKGLSLDPRMITLKRAQLGEDAAEAHISSIVANIDSREYSSKRLFIQEFDTLQERDTFYGISVCSEYEVFTHAPEIIGL